MENNILRQTAEMQFAEEIEEIKKQDKHQIPVNWQMSPQAVVKYLIGGKLPNGFVVSPKYIGNQRLMEIAVATLTTDRALLLYGLPGTAKSWVSEHITAAITGNSGLVVQGTAGTSEESVRYGWNYALLLSKGP
ncbi:MAG: AAA family ATPase, partial [Chitinophagales bacterium]|nr:AAA family ATPase [Chitinophagales bacterium]